MRRLIPALTLFLAACATRPQQPPATQQTVVTPSPQSRSNLLGLTAGQLVQLFGNPALQVREGPGLKLQFRGRGCILDAYLYSPLAGGAQRVEHVDTRWQSGIDADQARCIATLYGR
jgi:hypothetical protein